MLIIVVYSRSIPKYTNFVRHFIQRQIETTHGCMFPEHVTSLIWASKNGTLNILELNILDYKYYTTVYCDLYSRKNILK